ncbi:folate family ECF transporter S component [Butyrivibrio sp. YAB3001]|uniref:folate family ECF transporter S component n=1 Tax=Butyrivibrio sp. YAB3001 TaxID=1520812 RepID=UPI0008F625D6|nr:folate family ECF transporter S component [Butyrivibrio sp. YAB3001]SFB68459.1 ECF transporter S component, folate family [Butyrivibrio sp. YAB3001]
MSKNTITQASRLSSVKDSFSSVSRLKETKVLTFCGMMGALAIVLGYVATIKFGPYIRIGFSGLPNQVVDYLFGPWIGAIFGGTMDIIKWFVSGDGDFFPGFTITAMLGAIIYGLFIYNKPLKLWRIIAAQVSVKIVCNIILNTLWLNLLYSKAILAILPGRIVSNAVMLPIDVIIMYLLLQVVSKTIKPYFNSYK